MGGPHKITHTHIRRERDRRRTTRNVRAVGRGGEREWGKEEKFGEKKDKYR